MTSVRRFRALAGVLAGVLAGLALGACEHPKAPARSDSTAVRPAGTTPTSSPRAPSTWDRNAGQLLLVATDSASRAYLVVPDSASAAATFAGIPHAASVTLFGRGGTVQSADLDVVGGTDACYDGTLRAAPPPRAWSVGFLGGVVAPLPMDSTAALSHADSAALVVDMNRLASALPNDSAGRFAGLPFVVHSLWRFTIPSGRQVVIATLERQLNQEASPLAERTLLVTERAAGDTSYATTYSERSYGDEETIETDDVLAAVLIGTNKVPAIIVATDFGDELAWVLVERGADEHWHRRWSSYRNHC